MLLILGVLLCALVAIPPQGDISNQEWDRLNEKVENSLGKEITWKIYATE